MTEPQNLSGAPEGLPIGRTVLTGMMLRRFGLLPMVALALAGRGVSPARRRVVLSVAAALYLGAVLTLLLIVVFLVGGLALVALSG